MKRVVEKVQFIPKMPVLLNVAAYAKVSSGKDAMLHSLSAQVSYYSKKIQKHPGWKYCGVYADVYNQRLIPFDTKKAVQTPKITAFESKNADRKPLFLFYEAMMFGCWIHQCTRQMGGGCICTQAK